MLHSNMPDQALRCHGQSKLTASSAAQDLTKGNYLFEIEGGSGSTLPPAR